MSAESNSSSSSPSSGPERAREPENIMDLSIRGEFALLPLSIKTQLIQLLLGHFFLFTPFPLFPFSLPAVNTCSVVRGVSVCMCVCVLFVFCLHTDTIDYCARERAQCACVCV